MHVLKQRKSTKPSNPTMNMSTVRERFGVENPAFSLPGEVENETIYEIAEKM